MPNGWRHAPQKEGGLKILCDLPPVCVTPAGTSNELDVQNGWEENTHKTQVKRINRRYVTHYTIKLTLEIKAVVIINGTLARSLEPVVTECKEHTIHTQTQIVASRKPKEIKHTHEGEANFTT